MSKKMPSAQSGGVLLQVNLVSIIIFSVALVIAAATVTFGLLRIAAKNNSTSKAKSNGYTVDETNDVHPATMPPWGNFIVHNLDLEQPDEYVAYEIGTNKMETWTFENSTPEQVRSLMQACGVDPKETERALSSSMEKFTNNSTVIVPDDELIFSLSPEVRAKLYAGLGRFGENELMQYPFCFPGRAFDALLADARVKETALASLKKLVYVRGNAKCFSDLQVLLNHLPAEADRMQLVKMLSHQSALLVRVHIWPDTDIDKLIGYWTWPAAVRLLDMRPLLDAIKREPEGGSMSILYFLPPFARQRLYTYPLPSAPGDPAMDCHWSTMNFFNETPDNRFSDPAYTVNYLKSNYYEIARPSAYGDLVFLLNKNGNAIHSAVYLANDIVFTKNGNNFAQPWMLMHLKDLVAEYTSDEAPRMAVYRNRNW